MFYNHLVFKLLLGTFLLWVGLFYSTVESTVAIWYRSETFAHCFIIFPICIYLIKQKWPDLVAAKIQQNLKVLVLVFGALLVWLFGNLAQLLVVEQAAAFAILPLMIWTALGNCVARILMFTMAFWMFSVPVGEFLIPQLQELTADITVWSIQMTGIPVYREGLYIAIPGGLFEVAVACSGIRYLIASFTLGTLFAYLNYNSTKKRLIFVLFSIALPLLANGIRAYGIVMIAHLSEMKYATGVDHLVYGWLFFGVVILIMFAVGGIWADPLPEKREIDPSNQISADAKQYIPGLLLVVAMVGLTLAYRGAVVNPVSELRPSLASVVTPERDLSDTSWLPIFKTATTQQSGHADGLDYFVAYYDRNEQGQELISSANKLFNFERWSIVRRTNEGNYGLLRITNNQGKQRILAYTYVTQWEVSPASLRIKLVQAMQAFLGQPPVGMLVVVSEASRPAAAPSDAFNRATESLFTPALSGMLEDD